MSTLFLASLTHSNRCRLRAFSLVCVGALLFSGSACSLRELSAPPSSSAFSTSVEAKLETLSESSQTFTEENYKLVQYPESSLHEGDLILVNNTVSFLFPDNQQDSLVPLLEQKGTGYKVKDNSVLVDNRIMDSLNTMMEDFYQETGYGDVTVVSGFRTKEYQQLLLDREIQQSDEETALKWVAKPGGSEHHTGLAIDFSLYHDNGISGEYDGTGETSWINGNSWKYGFILRYPEDKREITGIYYEPWHFRFVGIPHAAAIAKKGMCLEEYIDYLKQFTFEGSHLQIAYSGKSYEIWFEYGNQAHVPAEGNYTVSGNNIDGFIVTAEQNP